MKRLLLLSLTTLSVLAGMAIAPASQAAATCSTHSLGISAWSEQQNWIDYNASFQCGGAVNTRYRVKITLQEDAGGWIQPGCQAGPCITYRPSATTWYDAGTSHSWSGQFNPSASIAGQDFRIRADVIFANGDPTVQFFSNRRTV